MTTFTNQFNTMSAADGSVAMDELLAIGPLQAFLVKGPTVTFWRYRYPRYAMFVMLSMGKTFQGGKVRFGGVHIADLSETTADLLYYTYVVLEVPGIHPEVRRRGRRGVSAFPSGSQAAVREADRKAYHNIGALYASDCDNLTEIGYSETQLRQNGAAKRYQDVASEASGSTSGSSSSGEPYAYWTNAIGQLLIKRAVLLVGGHGADVLHSDYLYMWEELSGKAGKRLREMIGKRRTRAQLKRASAYNQRLYVPIPMYFTQTSGNAFPICATRRSLELQIEFEQLNRCIVVSDRDVNVIRSNSGRPITDEDLVAWVDGTYVFVSTAQRRKFSQGNFDQLMTQVQMSVTPHIGTSVITVPIRFTHPIIELIWAVRRQSSEATNNWFNYSGIGGADPITTVALKFDSKFRVSAKDAKYYRTVTPYQAHSSIPKGCIYCMPFAIDAESDNPNGASNFGIFTNVEFIIELQRGLESEQITFILFGRNYNIMRFKRVTVGPLFN